jgi:hypothetical protein
LARSILALAVRVVLILHPDKTRPMLVNLIGMFWLTGGTMSVRRGVSGERTQRLMFMNGGAASP